MAQVKAVIIQKENGERSETAAILETPKEIRSMAVKVTARDRIKKPLRAVVQIFFLLSKDKSGSDRNLIDAWLNPRSKADKRGAKLPKRIKMPYCDEPKFLIRMGMENMAATRR